MKIAVITCTIVISLFLQACSTTEQKQTSPAVVKIGDVTIAYDKAGSGDTTILFVHRWAINRSFWRQQVNAFAQRYTVVAVDLSGHGESGRNRNSWSINDFANDVTAVIDTLQLKKVILVGHSMAGDIVVETALARPNDVIGIIGIDNLNNFASSYSPEEQKQMDGFIQALKQTLLKQLLLTQKARYSRKTMKTLFLLTVSSAASNKRILRSQQIH